MLLEDGQIGKRAITIAEVIVSTRVLLTVLAVLVTCESREAVITGIFSPVDCHAVAVAPSRLLTRDENDIAAATVPALSSVRCVDETSNNK